jgi:hypothetical protein
MRAVGVCGKMGVNTFRVGRWRMRVRWPVLATIVLALCALVVSACIPIPRIRIPIDIPTVRVPGTIRGSGNVVGEEREVDDFDHISLTGIGRVVLSQGERTSLTVRTDDNLLPYIGTEVRNGILVLGFSDQARGKSLDPSELAFHLQVREISRLDLSGAGSVEASALDTDRLRIDLSGAGSITVESLMAEELVVRLSGVGNLEVAGEVSSQDADLSGLGAYQAAHLRSERAIVEVSGAGAATVWATESLDVRISGAASVEYYGRPSVTQDVSLVGRLVSRGEAPE